MATRPTIYPRWAETAAGSAAANIVEPPSGNKDTGWTTGQVPPSSWENWKAQSVYDWVKYLDTVGSLIATPFTKRTGPTGGTRSGSGGITFASTLGECGRLVTVNNDGTEKFWYSDNLGLTWTAGSATFGNVDSIGWNGTNFVAVGLTNGVMTSTDGITWTNRTGPNVAVDLHTITWSPSLSLWATGESNGKVGTSPTGTTWTERTTGLASGRTGVVWGATPAVFVAMTAGGATTTSIATSANGTAWSTQTSPSGMVPNPAYAPFATPTFWGISTTANKTLYTSPTGVTWTLVFTSPTSTYLSPDQTTTWAWNGREATQFSTVANAPILLTQDGITWVQRANPASRVGGDVKPLVCALNNGALGYIDDVGPLYLSVQPSY